MKKFLIFLMALSLLTGCSCAKKEEMKASDRVDEYFSKYQDLDEEVLEDLNNVIETDDTLSYDQKEEYREIMKNHYKDLEYDIQDEVINGDSATVTVKIKVTDFSKVLSESKAYLEEHEEEFQNDEGVYDVSLYNDYRLSKLKEAKDKVEYTIDLTLSKVDDKWYMDDIDSVTESKINGTYQY